MDQILGSRNFSLVERAGTTTGITQTPSPIPEPLVKIHYGPFSRFYGHDTFDIVCSDGTALRVTTVEDEPRKYNERKEGFKPKTSTANRNQQSLRTYSSRTMQGN